MPAYPWRFESNLQEIGEANPMVIVYLGESYTEDDTGKHVLHHDYSKSTTVRLSDLPAFLLNPVIAEPTPHTIPPGDPLPQTGLGSISPITPAPES